MQSSSQFGFARGLTRRSSGTPTARRAGHRAQGLRPILRSLSSASRRWHPLSSTLGCKASISALPPPQKTKSMHPSRPASVKPQVSSSQLGCRARFAISAFSSSALSRLHTDQCVSTNGSVWRAGADRQLLACRSRTRDRASLAGRSFRQLRFSHGVGIS